MPVLLSQSGDTDGIGEVEFWLATDGSEPGNERLDSSRRLPDLSRRLEDAFLAERQTWWRLGRDMAASPSAETAHAPTCGSVGSDFGIMLAWDRVVGDLAESETAVLVICGDPWLFRHLAAIKGVSAGRAPGLWQAETRLRLRGILSRIKTAVTVARASVSTRRFRAAHQRGDPTILVYGHPASTADGMDAYFGDLMRQDRGLKRLLHTDCRPADAEALCADGRSASLHAWGHTAFALLRLPFVTWRPGKVELSGPHGWLVRRAAARENGGGGPAMNRWQMHCQRRWLNAVKPRSVTWPWENFAWERDLARAAKACGTPCIGYQHTVIGPYQLNYNVAINPDGPASLPDTIVTNGAAYRRELAAWGVPEARMVDGGAFRIVPFEGNFFDPLGPVFVPLSGDRLIADRQVAVARRIAETGRRVLVKDHPMYPVNFAEQENMHRTDKTLRDQTGLSAVLYTTGTSGLEALLAGLPAIRLRFPDRISIDVLPAALKTLVADENDVISVLESAPRPQPVAWDQIFSPVDKELWNRLINRGADPDPNLFIDWSNK